MRNKGYTLIELLGVMIILALLVLLVFPSVVNFIKSSSKNNDDLITTSILSAAELYVDNYAKYSQVDGINFCVSLSDLSALKYISKELKLSGSDENIVDTKSVSINYFNGYTYEIIDNKDCQKSGLIPVVYDGENWVVADVTQKWYDYSNQEWANAVILNGEVTKSVGEIVTVDGDNPDVKAMFVWIPRYEYKIEGEYGTHSDGSEGTYLLPGEIKINLISRNKVEASDGYTIHPAFTFGSDELSGIWVGKFETSHIELSSNISNNNLGCTTNSCPKSNGIRILPNMVSLRYNNVFNLFTLSRSMSTEFGLDSSFVNSHMVKNVEWGAVAYLSQSKYGKYGNSLYVGENKEIYQNGSSNYKTGESTGSPAKVDSSVKCSYNMLEDRGDGIGFCGGGASTTGNETGIYDMSGGALEYVMAYYTPAGEAYGQWGATKTENYSGFLSSPNKIYYDEYKIDISSVACNNSICYGHALSETEKWYNDGDGFVNDEKPWLMRGGGYNSGDYAGVFASYGGAGNSGAGGSFRIALILASDE